MIVIRYSRPRQPLIKKIVRKPFQFNKWLKLEGIARSIIAFLWRYMVRIGVSIPDFGGLTSSSFKPVRLSKVSA